MVLLKLRNSSELFVKRKDYSWFWVFSRGDMTYAVESHITNPSLPPSLSLQYMVVEHSSASVSESSWYAQGQRIWRNRNAGFHLHKLFNID